MKYTRRGRGSGRLPYQDCEALGSFEGPQLTKSGGRQPEQTLSAETQTVLAGQAGVSALTEHACSYDCLLPQPCKICLHRQAGVTLFIVLVGGALLAGSFTRTCCTELKTCCTEFKTDGHQHQSSLLPCGMLVNLGIPTLPAIAKYWQSSRTPACSSASSLICTGRSVSHKVLLLCMCSTCRRFEEMLPASMRSNCMPCNQ